MKSVINMKGGHCIEFDKSIVKVDKYQSSDANFFWTDGKRDNSIDS